MKQGLKTFIAGVVGLPLLALVIYGLAWLLVKIRS